MTAVQDPVLSTPISVGNVIVKIPPLDGILFFKTIVNLYSVILPTMILPLGELTVTEVNELKTNAKLLVVAAVPSSITYPSVV